MKRNGWHMQRGEDALVLARHWPPRFDVAVSRDLPPARAGRLAHQIRQDLWRALRGVRGFSPVVRVADHGLLKRVTVGGRLPARSLPHAVAEARIAELLDCPHRRARWAGYAAVRAA